jgi:hypothetical protein
VKVKLPQFGHFPQQFLFFLSLFSFIVKMGFTFKPRICYKMTKELPQLAAAPKGRGVETTSELAMRRVTVTEGRI